jgi:hypothetical protein
MTRTTKQYFLPAFTALALAGCGRAPSVDVLGSFFPVWMLCLTIGIVLTFVLRFVLVRCRLESEVGPLALFYPSAVIAFTCAVWMLFYR